jgi:hypothetical protein
MKTIQPRIKNPATLIPDALEPVNALFGASFKGGVPRGDIGPCAFTRQPDQWVRFLR